MAHDDDVQLDYIAPHLDKKSKKKKKKKTKHRDESTGSEAISQLTAEERAARKAARKKARQALEDSENSDLPPMADPVRDIETGNAQVTKAKKTVSTGRGTTMDKLLMIQGIEEGDTGDKKWYKGMWTMPVLMVIVMVGVGVAISAVLIHYLT